MTIKFPALMMFALLTAASASAQSANRSGAAPSPTAAHVEALAPERQAISRCRAHCDSVTVAGAHATAPRQSVAERQARQTYCAKRMAS